ncbi:FAD-binding protein, partial [uncultured Paracoccus sp.]|uniref:FAD-binding protein n=1 Tax=uncultured Paracoccus sp. TaxID=189685 RepID=UPI0025942393
MTHTSSHGMTVNDFGLDHAHWRNWVGNQSCVRAARAAPTSEDELCALIAEAAGKGMNVRVAGSGHSFTPVALTSGLHLTLANMKGVKHIDHDKRRVTAAAGTTINELVKVLKAEGLSMINQGDIDSQALAGALTTGTHGTGARLPVLADAIVGMKLVQPDGSILTVDESTPDLLLASRVSLGVLGARSEMTLQLRDSDNLREMLKAMLQAAKGTPIVAPLRGLAREAVVKQLASINASLDTFHLIDPLPYLEFGYLTAHAKGIITDSGNVAEEATFNGVPCATLNSYTEHIETVRTG